mgnify:CR=1 FL=1
MLDALIEVFKKFDLTEIFKTKGKLKRWSAKRSIGGVVITAAIADISKNGITELNLVLCGIGVLPLLLSFFERN